MNQYNDIQINVAEREKLFGAIMFQAPSGGGKTVGALILAYGMMKAKYPEMAEDELWKKIGLVDTEHNRALVNVNMLKGQVKIGRFLHVPLKAPFSVERMTFAVGLAKQAGCEVCIIDSSSHVWEGTGGIQDYQQQLGGRFQDWRTANKDVYEPFVKLITGELHDMHMICTSRTKQEHAMVVNELGKTEVKKLGMKPIQRDSLEYEFQIVFNVDMEQKASVSKDNSGLFIGMYETITPEHGKLIYEWLDEGKDIVAEREAEAKRIEEQRAGIAEETKRLCEQWGLQEWLKQMEAHPYFGGVSVDLMEYGKLMELRQGLQGQIEALEGAQNVQNTDG